MAYVLLLIVGIPTFALAFTVVTYGIGIFSERFRPSNASFGAMYKGFLAIAAIYLILALLGLGGIFGLLVNLGVMAVAYRYIFDASWLHSIVIGIFGGILGAVGFVGIVALLQGIGMTL